MCRKVTSFSNAKEAIVNSGMVGVMLGVSVFIGFLGLVAFLWGLRSGQFDDEKKMMQGVLFDGEEELQEAALIDKKKREMKREPSMKENNNGGEA
nr:cbb3-type cytochrome oxidase assembly protein CcoS [Wolinella succinogenes]